MGASAEIGVISDTHGRLRPQAVRALEGCVLVLHAGDVCGPHVVEELTAFVAPCLAVRGNCDDDPQLPAFLLRVEAGVRVLVHHGHLPVDEAAHAPAVVITGHTHVPLVESCDGVLRLNPGSAGPRRFRLPVTVARLTLGDGEPRARIIELPVA
ncbi:MAG: metallophosphoesterase family protein [Verrucomicrobia bacterium]|nr:metallophosphoesterase family protein [Verrucomicrobiota bacterium]